MFDSSYAVPVVAIIAGCSVAGAAIVFGALRSMSRTRAIENSRREISAYVAEGSMTPEEAEKLLNAGPKHSSCGGRD